MDYKLELIDLCHDCIVGKADTEAMEGKCREIMGDLINAVGQREGIEILSSFPADLGGWNRGELPDAL